MIMSEQEGKEKSTQYLGTRSSRKKQRRRNAEQSAQEKPRGLPIFRRRLGQVAIAGAAVAATAGVAVAGHEIYDRFFSEKSAVLKEAERLGIKLSEKERNLWDKGSRHEPNYYVVQNQETLIKATKMFQTTLDLSRQSENPIFKQTMVLFDRLQENGQLKFLLRPPGQGDEDEVPIQTAARFEGGKNLWVLEVSARWVINRLDPIDTALFLAHEMEHVRSEHDIVNNLVSRNPNTTDGQKLSTLRARAFNRQEAIAEEARGYGVGAQAFIWHAGLTGDIHQNRQTDDLKRVVGFIKAGSRVDSPAWQNYIEVNKLIQLDHTQPQ